MASLSVSDAETQCDEKMDFTRTHRSVDELDKALKKSESIPGKNQHKNIDNSYKLYQLGWSDGPNLPL